MSNRGVAEDGGRSGGILAIAIAGAVGGAIGGWISATILTFYVRHVFASTIFAALVWTGRIASWYALLGLVIGVVGAAVALLLGNRSLGGFASIARSPRAVSVVGLGATLLLTSALVLNFAILPRPIQADFARIIANIVVAVGGATVIYLAAHSVSRGAREPTRSAWLLIVPLAASCAWILPLSPDPRWLPERFIQGDRNACAIDAATQLTNTHSGQRPNLILLTIDALRADHLSAYGYPRATSPFLAKLSTDAVLFERAFATKASTSTAIASFLTSRLPWAHGVSHPSEILPEDNLTIAEALKAAGYKTGAVVENGNVFPLFRYNQGFDDYDYGSYKATDIADRAIAWLARQSDSPFFLWMHYLDPHSPYSPPAAYTSMFVDDPYYTDAPLSGPYPDTFRGATPVDHQHAESHHVNTSWYIAQYDGEIRYTDDQIARVYEALEARGRTRDTWFVVSADHGECFGEQDYFGHGELAHDCGLHVPLIIRPPGGTTGRRVSDLTSMVDLVPTLLGVLGFQESGCFQGRSRAGQVQVAPATTKSGPSPILATAGFITHAHGGNRFVLRNERWKFVKRNLEWIFDLRSPLAVFWLWNALPEGGLADDELYDLQTDPDERENLIRRDPAQAKALEDELVTQLGKTGPLHVPATRLSSRKLDEVAPDILENLKVLGYIQ